MIHLLIAILDDLRRMPAVLQAWQAIGLSGSTILESAGAYRTTTWLSHPRVHVACVADGKGWSVGASANVVVASLAERSGHPISFRQFLKYGLITTGMSLVLATAYLWLRYL